MGRGPCTFRQADVERAVRAADKAGVELARIEIAKDGKIILVIDKSRNSNTGSEPDTNPWDSS